MPCVKFVHVCQRVGFDFLVQSNHRLLLLLLLLTICARSLANMNTSAMLLR